MLFCLNSRNDGWYDGRYTVISYKKVTYFIRNQQNEIVRLFLSIIFEDDYIIYKTLKINITMFEKLNSININ